MGPEVWFYHYFKTIIPWQNRQSLFLCVFCGTTRYLMFKLPSQASLSWAMAMLEFLVLVTNSRYAIVLPAGHITIP